MTETQKCLHHIAENMRMDKSIGKEGYEYFQQAIKNGIPLPKGHGRLIDRSELLKKEVWGTFGETGYDAPCIFKADVNDAPTILEADKEVEE